MRMKRLSDAEKWKLLAKTDPTQAAAVLTEKPTEKAAQIAEELGVAYMVNVVLELGSAEAADLLRGLPSDFKEKILAELPKVKKENLLEILSYPDRTVGSLMAKEYLAVAEHFNIRQTTEYLQSIQPHQKGKVSYVYVVNQENRLTGVVQIRDLLFYPLEKPVKEILISPVVQVEVGMSQKDAAKLLQRHRLLGLPVVDPEQRLCGVISADTALSVLEEEASDDIAKIVGTRAEEIKTRSAFVIFRYRLPWLLVSIASGITCAIITGFFNQDLHAVVALLLFVPVVLGLSESTGVQSATIVVRNLSLGQIVFKDIRNLFIKEMVVGVLIGFLCGTLVGAIASFWQTSALLGTAIFSSMALTITLSALIGLLLPFIFRYFRLDPAIAAGPIVLAICDIQTLLVYFKVSSLILS